MLNWDRTAFDKGASRIFHVVPYGSTAYSDLCQKYGGDNVFIPASATAEELPFTKALAQCISGRNDIIRIHAGTYTFSAAVTVAKTVTIEGASDNPGAVTLDCDTSDVACFSVTAAGVTLRNFTIDESASTAVNTIASTGTGTIVENVVIQGGNIDSTNATIYLTGADSVVRNCRVYLVKLGILVLGSRALVENNIVTGTAAGAYFGIRGDGAAAVTTQVVRNNLVFMSGATTTDGIAIEASSDLAVVCGNTVFAADPLDVEADTYGVQNHDLSATIVTTPAYAAE